MFLAVSALACGALVSSAFGQQGGSDRAYTPFMLSIVTPLQVPPRDFDVGGLRINAIYGECHDFDGLDLSALVGRATGHANGFQASLLANVVDGGGFGLQAGAVNYVKGDYSGLQLGLCANYIEKAKALQIGFYNGAEHIEGMQIGVINTTRTMIGLQIGLVNVIQDNDVPFLPIINCYF
jgi:hypothetical protein